MGEHISADKLRHEDVSTSSFRNLLGREFWLKFSRLVQFSSTTHALGQQKIFVFSFLAADENTWIFLLRPRVRPGRRGISASPKGFLLVLLDHLNSDGFVP